jgi:Zn-dependent M16 (insulinase) family peptidase
LATISFPDVRTIGGYTVKRREPMETLGGTYLLLEHERTGARHIHIQCSDDNNAFAVLFPTVPADSTGVAHILEHVVLAGSQRYPVHDPFFSMTKRSLATFMNAMTAADSTIYLYSTRNAKDFVNLMEVYLDAAFFPRLAEDSFRQEGVRLEFEQHDEPQSGLRYKGVVYNEMKGALSSPQAAVGHAIGKALFPGLTYEHVSGGDPAAIPDLTWDQLRRFHAVHYHPSNAYFYSYGNQPLEATLELIERNVLSHFERAAVDTSIPDVTRFDQPVAAEEFYPVSPADESSRKAQALVAWVTVPSADSFRLLAMRVLSDALLANAGSPLRKALVDSGLGSAMADGSGFHEDYREAVFGAGLKGMSHEDASRVRDVVLDTLTRLADEGLDESQVDAAIQHLEFEKRERSNAGSPYSLKLLFACMPQYRYGGDPYNALNFDADLKHLLQARSEGRFFENLIRAELLDNRHQALLTIRPDPELEERERKQELARLAEVESTLQSSDKARIVADAQRLKVDQEGKQDLSSLPTLELSDIPMSFEDVPRREVTLNGVTVEFYPQPTNGITYLDMRSDFSTLTPEQQDLLPLFSRVLTQSGAAGQDYVQVAARIAAHTGGVGAAAQVQSLAAQDNYLQSFVLSGRALDPSANDFVDLLEDLVVRLEVEPKRLKEIVGEVSTRLESSIAGLAFQFAILGAHSRLSSEGAMNERLQGVAMLRVMRRLAALTEGELGEVIAGLDEVRRRIFARGSVRFVVTCEEAMIPRFEELLAGFAAALPPQGPVGASARPLPLDLAPDARTAPVPVAFNVRLFKTVRYTHPDAPALLVLANYVRDTFLHREVREKGGAYGAYAQAGTASGTFYFGSYRDPNIVRTYEAFDRAVSWVIEGEITPDTLKEAILGACGDVDPLESPDIKGRREAVNRLAGFTREERERFKQRLLNVGGDDLRRVARTYLAIPNPVQSTVAGPDLIEAARVEKPDLFRTVETV